MPQWYLAVEDGAILGGLGVIDNDFHNRKRVKPKSVISELPHPLCTPFADIYPGRLILPVPLGHGCTLPHGRPITPGL